MKFVKTAQHFKLIGIPLISDIHKIKIYEKCYIFKSAHALLPGILKKKWFIT